jgi:NTE family protein
LVQKRKEKNQMDNVGVILAGGGGKGAYQVGAWLALQDMIKELNIKIDAFSGASVGALNGALFACCTPVEIDETWSEVTPDKILSLDCRRLIKKIPRDILVGMLEKTIYYSAPVVGWARLGIEVEDIVHSIVEHGLCNRDGLADIIEKSHIEERISRCNSSVLASCYNVDSRQMEYFKVNHDNCMKVLLASSALPIAFGKQQIRGKDAYIDGGVGDNLPIFPLLTRFDESMHPYRKFIVIHLEDSDKKYFQNANLKGCKLYHIFPKKGLKITGVLDFTQEGIQKKKNQGIREVEEEYRYIDEIRELFLDDSQREIHLINGKAYRDVETMYHQIYAEKSIFTNEELICLLEKGADEIRIDNDDLVKAISKLIKLKDNQFKVVLATLVAVMALELSSAGMMTPLAATTAAPAVAIVGPESLFVLVGLLLVRKTPKIISKIRNYECAEQEDGSLLLTSKKYIKEDIDNLKSLCEEIN